MDVSSQTIIELKQKLITEKAGETPNTWRLGEKKKTLLNNMWVKE